MDFTLAEDDEAFREELRDFLKRNHPGKAPRGEREKLQFARDWAAKLADEGWAVPAWPREWGGMDLPLTKQLVYHEEMTKARVPNHPSPNSFIVGPTLIRHGTRAQKERFLRRIVRADDMWCQGWSEPDAGSDLPALMTRAVRDGDQYVVTGQKVWTTRAETSNWMFALVRTGTPESRQHGLTYVLIDMQSEGLTSRPLRDITGGSHFSEVFFDEVRVPVDNRVGEENGGWTIARTSLGHERSTAFISADIRYRRVVDDLCELAREQGRADDPIVRQELAKLVTAVRLLGLNGARVLSQVLRGEEPGPASSVSRLFHGQFEKRLHEVAVEVIGTNAMLSARDPHAVQRGRWVWGVPPDAGVDDRRRHRRDPAQPDRRARARAALRARLADDLIEDARVEDVEHHPAWARDHVQQGVGHPRRLHRMRSRDAVEVAVLAPHGERAPDVILGEVLAERRVTDVACHEERHTDAFRAQLLRHRPREPVERPLAGGVEGHERHVVERDLRTDVHDVAAAAVAKQRDRGARRVDRAQEVRPDHRVDVLVGGLLDPAGARHAGDVQQDVDAPEPRLDRGEPRPHAVGVADVCRDRHDPFPDLGGDLAEALLAASQDHDVRALVREPVRSRLAHPGRPADDDDDLANHRSGHRRSPRVGMDEPPSIACAS